MKEFFPVEHVVGGSEEEKQDVRELLAERFREQAGAWLVEGEREKTAVEKEIIALVNEATDAERARFGLPAYEIPEKNFHVIAEGSWPKDSGNVGTYRHMELGMIMSERVSKLGTAATAYHEATHMKSFAAARTTDDEEPETFRMGLELHVIEHDGRISPRFLALNEAVTEELTLRFVGSLRRHPLFEEEIERHLKHVKDFEGVTDDKTGMALLPKEAFASRIVMKDGKRDLEIESAAYRQPRRILNVLVDKIHDRLEASFADRKEVFDLFAEAMFAGKTKKLQEAITGAFGPAVFKDIAKLSASKDDDMLDAFEEYVDAL